MSDFPTIDEALIDVAYERQRTPQAPLDARATATVEKFIYRDTLPDGGFPHAVTLVKERIPRIFSLVQLGWGTKELHEKLAKMLHVDTIGRQGFPPELAAALIKIFNRHADVFDLPPVTFSNRELTNVDRW